MTRTARKTIPLLLIVLLAVVIGGLLAGCVGSDDEGGHAEVIAAISFIDNAGYHEADESIQSGTIPATTESIMSKMRTVLLLTHWPEELETPARQLAAKLGSVQTAVATDQPEVAKVQTLSADAHATWHRFSTDVWTHLRGEAGVKSAGGADSAGTAPTPHSH